MSMAEDMIERRLIYRDFRDENVVREGRLL